MFNLTKQDILYEDADLIAINKPSGLPSQATLDPARDHAFAAVGRYLNGEYAAMHHRLDVGTSGVLLFSKSQRANPSLSAQFQEHSIQKTYVAISAGTAPDPRIAPEASFLLDAPIGEDVSSKIQKYCVNGKKRKRAVTHIACDGLWTLRDGVCARLVCQPETGRTHQIRVHLAHLGLPIVGDALYQPGLLRSLRAYAPDRLCLHARTLVLNHPVTGERLCIEAPVPTAFDKFVKRLDALARNA